MSDDTNKIEVVTGNGDDLEISPVYDHLSVAKPKSTDEKVNPKNIVIPKVKKIDDKKKEEKNKDKKN